jgi:putative FmdB family regulatory protein
MPTYNYHCSNCHRRFDIILSYVDYGKSDIQCPYCQSLNIKRKIGRIQFARSEESRLENIADPSNLAGLENDPKSLGKMMRQMSSETGEEMGPEFEEVIHRLESGQNPEEIEKQMPDLAGDESGMGNPGDFAGGDDF